MSASRLSARLPQAPDTETPPPSPERALLRLAAYTQGRDVPSARYRVRHYLPALAALGILGTEYYPGLSAYAPPRWYSRGWALGSLTLRLPGLLAGRRADVALIQREFIPGRTTLEHWTPTPRVLDVDDAIHLLKDGRAAASLAALADRVIVGNAFLAEAFSHWNRAIDIIPTPVDTEAYRPPAVEPEQPVIGWLGTAGNYPFLQAIESALATVMRRHPRLLVEVCSDLPPPFTQLPIDRLRFRRWSPQAELRHLAGVSIGLMPMDDTPWARGKCSYKMLQYMACGRPVVVSPVGMNAEVLALGGALGASSEAEWCDRLSGLLSDPAACRQLGQIGRQVVENHYSLAICAPLLAAVLRKAV